VGISSHNESIGCCDIANTEATPLPSGDFATIQCYRNGGPPDIFGCPGTFFLGSAHLSDGGALLRRDHSSGYLHRPSAAGDCRKDCTRGEIPDVGARDYLLPNLENPGSNFRGARPRSVQKRSTEGFGADALPLSSEGATD
jgi:hypothetical protein